MDFSYVATEEAKSSTWEAERRAADKHRFGHLKTKENKVLTAVVTAMLALFVRYSSLLLLFVR